MQNISSINKDPRHSKWIQDHFNRQRTHPEGPFPMVSNQGRTQILATDRHFNLL